MLLGGGLHSPSAFLVINIILYVFLEVREETSAQRDRAKVKTSQFLRDRKV